VRGRIKQNTKRQRTVGGPPFVLAAPFAGGLLPGDYERWQLDVCFAREIFGSIVCRAERVVDFDVTDERGRAKLFGVEEGLARFHRDIARPSWPELGLGILEPDQDGPAI
jgi:hypothetical protein